MKRKALTKKTRFAVFKRDSFRCQFCGRSAIEEQLVLHIDHLKPVAAGGTNVITNLVTACADCNQGKGKEELDDNSLVARQRRQLEELHERREIMRMIVKWREELEGIQEQFVVSLAQLWNQKITGSRLRVGAYGLKGIRKLLRQFSYEEVREAMHIAADQYELDTATEVDYAFSKLGGICFNRQRERASV